MLRFDRVASTQIGGVDFSLVTGDGMRMFVGSVGEFRRLVLDVDGRYNYHHAHGDNHHKAKSEQSLWK